MGAFVDGFSPLRTAFPLGGKLLERDCKGLRHYWWAASTRLSPSSLPAFIQRAAWHSGQRTADSAEEPSLSVAHTVFFFAHAIYAT